MDEDNANPRRAGGGNDNEADIEAQRRTTITLTVNGKRTTSADFAEELQSHLSARGGRSRRSTRPESSVEPPERDPDMPTDGDIKWWPAPIVAEVAERLIVEYHEHLMGDDFPIIYLFAKDPPKVRGRDAAGTAQKISGLNAFLFALAQRDALKKAGHEVPSFLDEPVNGKSFFVITIWYSAWRAYTPEQRMALVDHELAHCSYRETGDGGMEAAMRGHDVEEFYEIAERWGPWEAGLEKLFETLKRERRCAPV